jgi:methionyl aminopeptidase
MIPSMGFLGNRIPPRRLRHRPLPNLLQDYQALAGVLDELLKELEAEIQPGVKTSRFDELTESFIKRAGVESSFKGYRGYPAFVSTSLNQEVLHTPPSKRELKDGDLFKLQVGIQDGVGHSYQAWTYFVGTPLKEDQKFVLAGGHALDRAVRQMKPGNDVIDVSRAIQTTLESAGYAPNQKYVGHGMGRNKHELPQIPCCVMQPEKDMSHWLNAGQLASIQVIAHAGGEDCVTMKDKWSVETRDHSRAITLSQIVAVGDEGPIVITPPRNSQPAP